MKSAIFSAIRVLALPLMAMSLTGCFSFFRPARFVRHDADDLRREVHQYYEKEIMTNLVKAANGSFFIHTDINQLNATVSQKLTATVGGGQTLTNQGSRMGATLNASTQAVRPFTFGVTPEQDNTLVFNTVPVINDPTIYNAYVSYINLELPTGWDASIAPAEDKDKDKNKDKSGSKTDITPNKLLQVAGVPPQGKTGAKEDPKDRYLGMELVQRELNDHARDLKDVLQPSPKKDTPKYPVRPKNKGCYSDDPIKDTVTSLKRSKKGPAKGEPYVRGTLVVPSWSDELAKRHLSSETVTESPDNYFYWVPVDYAQAYFGLCMAIVGRQSGGGSSKTGVQLVQSVSQ